MTAALAHALETETPPGHARCPRHQELVRHDPGCLLGLCTGCARDAAMGLVWMRRHPYRKTTK